MLATAGTSFHLKFTLCRIEVAVSRSISGASTITIGVYNSPLPVDNLASLLAGLFLCANVPQCTY